MKKVYSISISLFSLMMSIVHCELLSVIQLNRHGARAAESFPNEPLNLFWGKDMKLSQNGYRQQQILGAYIRHRYITKAKFLSPNFDPKEFKIISTPTQRTIYSADGFIAGLYPGTIMKTTINEPGLEFISNDTIPVVNPPKDLIEVPLKVMSWVENSIFNSWNCRLNGKVIKEEGEDKTKYPDLLPISDEELARTAQTMANYYDKQKELDESTPLAFMKQINKLVIPDFYHFNKNFIKELGKEAYDTIQKMYVNKWYSMRNQDNVMLKLGVSEFFEKILGIFKTAIEATSFNKNFLRTKDYVKYTVFSAHDTTAVNLITNLIAFDYVQEKVNTATENKESYDFLIPPYASSFLFELHRDNVTQRVYAKILYNGKVLTMKFLGDIQPNNEGNFDFAEFEKLLKNRITPEWRELDCSEAKKLEDEEIYPSPSMDDYVMRNGKYYLNSKQ